jgi:hypothetical protein
MNKIIKLLLLVLLLGLSGCGDQQSGNTSGKTPSSLAVSPTAATVKVGAKQIFTATATYTDGTSGPVIPTWSISGSIGSIVSAGYSGVFTATQVGIGSVTATYQTVSASALITVEAAVSPTVLASIEVSPSTLQARVLAVQTFTAAGTNASGESVTIFPAWTMTGDAIGNFTSSGTVATLEALAEGTATINCSSLEVSGSASVVIAGHSQVITVESDTYVDEANPGTSYEADIMLKAGYMTSAPSIHYETYLRFSLASLPAGAVIETATLNLYSITAGTSSLQMYKLAGAFSAATTWASRPASGAFIMSNSFSGGQMNSISSTELLTAVQGWLATPGDNFGLLIRQDGAENGVAVLNSKENGTQPPTLFIEYQ